MFHTPPYSLQPVSLQECYENIGRMNISVTQSDPEPKSPTVVDPNVSPNERQSNSKETKSKDIGSPGIIERKGRRMSSSNRQSSGSSPHEVPYARLIDSPSNANRLKRQSEISKSPPSVTRYDSEVKILTPKSIRMPTPKASASESKLTVDYCNYNEPNSAGEMSHSAPQTHPIEFDSDQSIEAKIMSEEEINREVQRTISLTSENPSEAFFSADEDTHTTRSASLRTGLIDRVNQKKRFASDLR